MGIGRGVTVQRSRKCLVEKGFELKFAKHVHIVHTGECPGCTHVFDVDGAEFPWHITEAGPRVTRLMDDFYAVNVGILCLNKETREVSFAAVGNMGRIPVIGGVEFPWYITEDGFVFRQSSKTVPSVTLSFLASQVDVEGIPMIDARETYDNGGNRVAVR